MRTVHHLLEDKMDEEVTHYINSHQANEVIHLDNGSIPLSIHDEGGGRQVVTLMNSQGYHPNIHRSVSVGDVGEVEGGGWGEEILDADRLAAFVAHLAHNSRVKPVIRSEVDHSVMNDGPIRLFNHQALEESPVSSPLPRAPCAWLPPYVHKPALKSPTLLPDDKPDGLDLGSPNQSKHHSKKSLPHKKRISKKLKRNDNEEPHGELVVISVNQEEISPDDFSSPHVLPESHHIPHEPSPFQIRAVLICQLCGDFYGEDQLKFYQHLKHHYEPHGAIIIENQVPDLGIDKMTNTCIVDNVSQLPESLVELSLENTLPTTKSLIYQPMKEHILYTSTEKPLNYNNKILYSMACIDKEPGHEPEKTMVNEIIDSCDKCDATFSKEKQLQLHVKEAHMKITEELNEFSEPEDLMEGIQVPGGEEPYPSSSLLLTVDNGHVHQHRHWYIRDGVETPCEGAEFCTLPPSSPQQPPKLEFSEKEEPYRVEENTKTEKIKEVEEHCKPKKTKKKFQCEECSKIFKHRNSLLYHILSHKGNRAHQCPLCSKAFYTSGALKIHMGIHNGSRPHSCEECGKCFRQWGDLKYHIASIHSEQKEFECEYCGKQFARKYSYSLHRRIHTGEKNYKCHYCTKTFRASGYRLSHMRTHTGEKPHKCDVCGKCFRAGGDLRRHSSVHRRNGILEIKEQSPDNAHKKKHKKPPTLPTKPIKKDTINLKKVKTPKIDESKVPPNVTISRDIIKHGEFPKNMDHYKFREVNNSQAHNEIVHYKEFKSQKDRSSLRSVYLESIASIENHKDGVKVEIGEEKTHAQLTDVKPNVIESKDAKDSMFLERLTALYNITA